jgi:subtilisin family serine protease
MVLAAVFVPNPGSVAAKPPSVAGTPAVASTAVHVVTLVTGDRVTVTVRNGKASIGAITPGKGRSAMTFGALDTGGHLQVIPRDALPLLRAGRLDSRLFDLTALVDLRYDERRKDLPLIVTGGSAAGASPMSRMAGAGAVRAVPGGSALKPAKADLPRLWSGLTGGLNTSSAATGGLSKVWLDGLRKPSLDVSVPLIGAPTAWAAGFTGTGVKVAVVDTGIDSTHPDLAGKVIAAQDFSASGNTLDQVGHGTHVAATIASNDTRYRGVAPGAQLLSAKVCADIGCEESAILAGMQWAVEQGAKVVNMSLSGQDTPDQDLEEAAVEDLTARFGALFVIAAGNDGTDRSIESPGSASSALTVGAVTKTDELADFSSRGPRLGDSAIKPDITAPGVNIVAARSKDAELGSPGDTHLALSGTSMATPHVAGSAAILVQQHPDWAPARLKAALMASAKASPTIDVFAQGAGRVDVARAITQTIVADPPSVSFGLQQFPHTDDVPDVRTVTYSNLGGTDVTLDLSLTGSAPAGLFTLSANTLTVPAGGTASVTLTSDTRLDIPNTRYTGYLVAKAGAAQVSTPFAVDKEVESHNVTLRHFDRSGQPAQNFFDLLRDPATGVFLAIEFGAASVRIPKGRYDVLSVIDSPDGSATMLIEPAVAVDQDVTVAMDARNGRPVSVTVPLPDASPIVEAAAGVLDGPGGAVTAFAFGAADNSSIFAGSSDPNRRSPSVHSMFLASYSRAGADPAVSDYVALVMWHEQGRMFPGFTRRVSPADLATIHAEHVSEVPATGFVFNQPNWPDGFSASISPGLQASLPGKRTEYYNTDDGVRWVRELFTADEDFTVPGNDLFSLATRFEGGKQYNERRNVAPYGPGFSPFNSPPGWVSRRGDTMDLIPNVINDQLNWFGLPTSADTMRLTLDRDGTRLLDQPGFAEVNVPPGDARYRLGVDLTRHGLSTLSTSVSCVWTFRSATVHSEQGVSLPLSAVRFLPVLDNHNTAPAGRLWPVPLEVQRQPGSTAGTVKTLTVQVSYDDGATWTDVPVIRFGQKGLVVLKHPAGSGYVSLRASSTDSAGNTVNETVIRAYRTA